MHFICSQSKVKEEEMKFQQMIHAKQKEVLELKQAVDTIKVRSVYLHSENSHMADIWLFTPGSLPPATQLQKHKQC